MNEILKNHKKKDLVAQTLKSYHDASDVLVVSSIGNTQLHERSDNLPNWIKCFKEFIHYRCVHARLVSYWPTERSDTIYSCLYCLCCLYFQLFSADDATTIFRSSVCDVLSFSLIAFFLYHKTPALLRSFSKLSGSILCFLIPHPASTGSDSEGNHVTTRPTCTVENKCLMWPLSKLPLVSKWVTVIDRCILCSIHYLYIVRFNTN